MVLRRRSRGSVASSDSGRGDRLGNAGGMGTAGGSVGSGSLTLSTGTGNSSRRAHDEDLAPSSAPAYGLVSGGASSDHLRYFVVACKYTRTGRFTGGKDPQPLITFRLQLYVAAPPLPPPLPSASSSASSSAHAVGTPVGTTVAVAPLAVATELPFISHVKFELHETFDERATQVVHHAPFAIEEDAYGEFMAHVTVHFAGPRAPEPLVIPVDVRIFLALGDPLHPARPLPPPNGAIVAHRFRGVTPAFAGLLREAAARAPTVLARDRAPPAAARLLRRFMAYQRRHATSIKRGTASRVWQSDVLDYEMRRARDDGRGDEEDGEDGSGGGVGNDDDDTNNNNNNNNSDDDDDDDSSNNHGGRHDRRGMPRREPSGRGDHESGEGDNDHEDADADDDVGDAAMLDEGERGGRPGYARKALHRRRASRSDRSRTRSPSPAMSWDPSQSQSRKRGAGASRKAAGSSDPSSPDAASHHGGGDGRSGGRAAEDPARLPETFMTDTGAAVSFRTLSRRLLKLSPAHQLRVHGRVWHVRQERAAAAAAGSPRRTPNAALYQTASGSRYLTIDLQTLPTSLLREIWQYVLARTPPKRPSR
ncbi:hypothetical protein CXG81DRAFT_16594 [Caulochytrium protostelioides]|uniref:YEATS domain-containing protein n=1 Tax=Caulochytrium protostelioides TaxID=1555241 RepID=A0A4P9WVP2_9FUNG|nr:hypothetical protein CAUPRSCDRAFT_10906 [Caulochytrium protostelioides]RKP03886.1 hypothetical protein CXG81DRAFT_16594 [Caulochytrium protostelioides]|eukprot:RKP03886.1 hypothetical protein CXG81DRAFT_16594 [Caulochytrium protostelioides]